VSGRVDRLQISRSIKAEEDADAPTHIDIRNSSFCNGVGALSVPLAGSTEAQAQGPAKVDQPFPAYNPYPPLPGSVPPTVLPPDLQSELLRVRREVQTIFDRYFAEWQALTPPVLSNTQGQGNPPVLQGTGYQAVRILGGLLNYD
jgi:hypothetical protein